MRRTRATIRYDPTDDGVDPAVLERALEPDNTDSMESRVENGVLETRIERESVGGLRATADDYVSNLAVVLDVMRVAENSKRQE